MDVENVHMCIRDHVRRGGSAVFEPVLLFNHFEFVLAWTGKNLIQDQHFCSDVPSKCHLWFSESMHF